MKVETGAAIAGAVVIAGMVYIAWRAGPAWRDARSRGLSRRAALRWATREVARPGGYWWGGRLALLRPGEAARLLAAEATRLGLRHVTNATCLLCGAEMPGVLTLDEAGVLTARRESVCAACGFRLDACRFCVHFRPHTQSILGGNGWAGLSLAQDDESRGRCQRYRAWQPVQELAPHLARKLAEMGYEGFQAPATISDSYVPLDECRAFAFDGQKLRRAGLKNLDQRRAALIQLAQRAPLETRS